MSFDCPSNTAASSSSASASGSARKRSRPDPSSGSRNPRNVPRRATARKAPFNDFGSYMVEKNRKLHDQFEADASSSYLGGGGSGRDSCGGVRGIFHGVSIFVDGFTIPSNQELRGYMLKHGGRFENYFSRHRVTHIICNHLPDSKIRNLRAFSRGVPVVKPAWVIDSVTANKLLSWVPYQLSELVNESGKQKKLSAFFTLKSISNFNDAEVPLDPDEKIDAEGSSSKCDESEQLLLSAENELNKCRRQGSEESACLGHEKISEGRSAEPKFTDLQDEQSVVEALDSSPYKTSNAGGSSCLDKPLDIKCLGASGQHHSTLNDPNFVENYFKNSRLHFIGTWRSRYRKRFSNLLSGVKSSNTDVNSLSDIKKTAIIHIDMDCFFVSVIVRNCPDLLHKPVAVCHSDNPKGTAEISSANYPARDYGVKAGMFVRDAKARCPQLVIVPYDFEAYEEVADQFYSILHKHCNKVQALSCDEAFLDVTECANDDPEQVALMIRREIAETTRCTASAGIAENLLLARLATRSAKPNGQCYIPSEKVNDYMNDLPIKALPGIGHAISEKLRSRHVQTCGQLRMISKEALHKDFGTKIGDMLWNYCRGVDNRTVEVVQEMKSVGAEVNWGVRFNDIVDCQHFLMKLCKEVSLRLQGCGVQGRTITLKVKKRKKGAEEPIKFMGCGDCESMSRSITLPIATDNLVVLQRITNQIFDYFHIGKDRYLMCLLECADVKEVRGVGLQISRLVNVDMAKQGYEENALKSWLASSKKTIEQCKLTNPVKQSDSGEVRLPDGEPQPNYVDSRYQLDDGNSRPFCINETGSTGPSRSHESSVSNLPPLNHLDIEVIKNLPPEIFSEVNDMYNGKLCDIMEQNEVKDGRANAYLATTSLPELNKAISSSVCPKVGCGTNVHVTGGQIDALELYLDSGNKGKQPICPAVSIYDAQIDNKVVGRTPYQIQSASASCSRSNDLHINSNIGADRVDLMPGSLSQADLSILQEFPEDVRADIFELLPAHRSLKSCSENAPSWSARKFPCAIGTQNTENSEIHLWIGNPPKWVDKFKVSNCFILNIVAELYTKPGTNGLLSSILQSLASFLPLTSDSTNEEWDEALSSLCELLMQYINLKIESDIEELYICFRIMERFTSMSKLLLQVYNIVLPPLQASVSEYYGGELQLFCRVPD